MLMWAFTSRVTVVFFQHDISEGNSTVCSKYRIAAAQQLLDDISMTVVVVVAGTAAFLPVLNPL